MSGRLIPTFLDTGVLITAYNGQPGPRERALAVLEDPKRVFLSSPFVRHECCPKALFNKRLDEYRFYREYFLRAAISTTLDSYWSAPAAKPRVRE